MSSGYLRSHEIKNTRPIKATPSAMGIESQRACILMKANGQPSGSYLWNSVVANSSSPGNQAVIERAIAEEMKVLEFQGLPHTYVDAARSLLISSGIYELTEAGLLIPSTASSRLDDSTLEG
jgi:hypothetical protein